MYRVPCGDLCKHHWFFDSFFLRGMHEWVFNYGFLFMSLYTDDLSLRDVLQLWK